VNNENKFGSNSGFLGVRFFISLHDGLSDTKTTEYYSAVFDAGCEVGRLLPVVNCR